MRGPGHGTKGAVYVEFLIAFLPLFVFFLSLCQLAYVQAAHVVVQHAAVMATRAAIVVLPDDPQFYDGAAVNSATGQRFDDIERAAKIPLKAAVADGNPEFTISFPGGETVERNSLVQVKVELDYPCKVPIGALFVCPNAGIKKLSGISAMPNQGAGFEYSGGE